MQKISHWSDLVTPQGEFRYGSVLAGQPPTPMKAEWLNAIQAELANFILAYLPALDALDNQQLLKAARQLIANLAVKSTTLAGYGISDAYTKAQTDSMVSAKANWGITLAAYGIGDAYTKTTTDGLLSQKANNAVTLAGYGIGDAYTKAQTDLIVSAKANWGITLAAYGIGDAYTKAVIDAALATKQDKNTALMAANGWRLDKATGLLEQWGIGYCGPDSQTGAIDFPTPFAEVYNCFGNKVTPNAIDGDANAAGALALSATQYQLFNDTSGFGATIHWRALGRAPGY
ncbi:gp53-like domain-containing protein [Pseudomonas laurylsulfatiphila]|uniref:gp53-like domain-containing protein n=1 Tax=Pseudomonas laurylsulfatiphila TaxID=2011015 RepID=UPI003D1CD110